MKIKLLFGLLVILLLIGGCSKTNNISPVNNTSQAIEQPIQNSTSDLIIYGCQYDNPKCEGGYKCINNKCSEIQHHSGGGGSIPLIIDVGGY